MQFKLTKVAFESRYALLTGIYKPLGMTLGWVTRKRLVTEKEGEISDFFKTINSQGKSTRTSCSMEDSQSGLLDITTHPQFAG